MADQDVPYAELDGNVRRPMFAVRPRQSATPRRLKHGTSGLRSRALRRAFLDAYVRIGTVRETCRRLHIDSRRIYEWRDRYPDFAESLKDCEQAAIDKVETSLYKQALRPRGTADRIFFLKKRKPEVYGDYVGRHSPEYLNALAGSHEPTTNVSVTHTMHTSFAVEMLTDEELATMIRLLQKMGVTQPVPQAALPAGPPAGQEHDS